MRSFFNPYPLSVIQRATLIPYFGINALRNPERGDLVAALGDITSEVSLRRMKAEMCLHESGRKLFQQKPLVTQATLGVEVLRTLPSGRLGREYMRYMDTHGFSADERSIVRFISDSDLAYTLTRYRQIHDFWHVLSGLPPSVLGEIALKAFEFEVTGLPVCLLSTVLGPVKLSDAQRLLLQQQLIPWATKAARQLPVGALMAYPYEDRLHHTVDDVRNELNFLPAPEFPVNEKSNI